MIALLLTWVLSAFLLSVTAFLVPGFRILSFGSALVAVVVIGFLNALLRPILLFLTLPVNILTLGLFTFVVNAAVLRIAANFVDGFRIDGWIPAIIGGLVLAILNALIQLR